MKQEFNTDEPMTFANMTVFVSPTDGLILHAKTSADSRIMSGVSVEKTANYYLNYKEREMARFMPMARRSLVSVDNHAKYLGLSPKERTPEEKQCFLEAAALEYAARVADNCEDSHDLSPEFCEAAENLGETLMTFAKTGVKTMIVHSSYRNAETVIASYMKPKVA